jgi:L-alanine-DL-glutamate epimerase-like enolase superfamily enzyme
MKTRIESIDLFLRPLPPGRMEFTLGRQKAGAEGKPPAKWRPQGIATCRVRLRSSDGRKVTGCAGDRPSYGWLDKRGNRDSTTKMRALVGLMEAARDVWLAEPEFDALFPHWLGRHREIERIAAERGEEELTGAFCSALIERALIDALCRALGQPLFRGIRSTEIGFRPGLVHPELKALDLAAVLPPAPVSRFFVRHTVGLSDPITAGDIAERVDDGEPESLDEYVRRDGLRYFKIKISGDPQTDCDRLARIWEVLPKTPGTVVTLDGNEAYEDLGEFAAFIDRLEAASPGIFQHILFIEQPLTRRLTFDPASRPWIDKIRGRKPLVIDEADGKLDAFRRARRIGYDGTSHKNCKGFFKSLMNHALCAHYLRQGGRDAFLTGEDLSLMPLVSLHQDYAALGLLGIRDCERNGHHYSFGLSHLTAAEKETALRDHPDLYARRGDEVFLHIVGGAVSCASVQEAAGFGVKEMPDWAAMQPLRAWLDEHYPEA